MDAETLKQEWLAEEALSICGWDFSHIHGRYTEEEDLPWDYEALARSMLRPDMRLLDYDTGGGEFLLRLGHPPELTAATEGYAPNVALCRERLLPLGIDFQPCDDPAAVPFEDGAFDRILNRHGDLDARETWRLLRRGGVFLTEQVGAENDRDLVELVLQGLPAPFPKQTLREQETAFRAEGFSVLQAQEAFRPIRFYDVGAFVWFAHVIEWEFPGFSVERCFERLLALQRRIECCGNIQGTIHRFLLVVQKP